MVSRRAALVGWLLLCASPWHAIGQSITGAGGADGVVQVRELRALMYPSILGTNGCYKLLNATSAVGCEDAGNQMPNAPLIHLRDLPDPLYGDRVVLVPAAQALAFLQRLAGDALLAQHVKGVLVDDSVLPAEWSSEPAFPGAAYAPYNRPDYVWNLAGSSLNSLSLKVPVMALTPELAAAAQERATFNQQQGFDQALYHASFKFTMNAVQPNASACLAARTCNPLGGYSVWAALPPLPPPGQPDDDRPLILVLAQMDGRDLFHDLIQGADAPMSGLIAMLGAVYALKAGLPAGTPDKWTHRVVFVALAGEGWGYMGSQRLLWELQTGGSSVQGLSLERVDQVIEIGQVGGAASLPSGHTLLLAHSQQGPAWGDSAPLLDALFTAADDVPAPASVRVAAASSSNPGVPPSSLMSFLRANASIRGVVLAEFDSVFSNPYYGSRFDNATAPGFKGGGLAAAAGLVAAALQRLAGGDPSQLQLNVTELRGWTDSLVECLLLPAPGMSCPAVTALMTPGYAVMDGVTSYAARHYVGVLQTMPPDPQNVNLKPDVARFLWNVLAVSTMQGQQGASCDPVKNVCPAGQACAGWKRGSTDPQLMGHCVNATARYVPAMSMRINCTNCDAWTDLSKFSWQESMMADAWLAAGGWPPDPMWVESDWPLGVPALELYLRESPATEDATLGAGFAVTAASVLAAWLFRRLAHSRFGAVG